MRMDQYQNPEKSRPSGGLFPRIPGQNPWLDLVRALAILLVLLRHGVHLFPAHPADRADTPFTWLFATNGWAGVDLFLVLSGFLITGGLIRLADKGGQIRPGTYLRNRALRIIPAYYAVLFLTAFGAFPFYAPDAEGLGWRIIYHLLFLQDYLPADINVAFWSLGVEEKFYLLAPFLVLLLLRLKNPAWQILLLSGLMAISPLARTMHFLTLDPAPDYAQFFREMRSPFHACLEPLLTGVAIAFLRQRMNVRISPSAARQVFLGCLLMLAVWLSSHDFMARISLIDVTLQPFLLSMLFGTMVFAASCLDTAPPPPGEVASRVLARLSYTLYLVHVPLIPLALVMSAGQAGPDPVRFWAFYLCLSVLGAVLIHIAVERPFLSMKQRLERGAPFRPGMPAKAAPLRKGM